jgi:hypothetical protein
VEQAMEEGGADVALGTLTFDQFTELVRTNSLDSLDLYEDR